MTREAIPASISARLVRAASVVLVMAMVLGLAPFAPTAPEMAGFFGEIVLKSLLACVALLALLGALSSSLLAVALAATGSCQILAARAIDMAAGMELTLASALPIAGPVLSLVALAGLRRGQPRLVDRRADDGAEADTGPWRRLPGHMAGASPHPDAVRPRRVTLTAERRAPRPQRVQPAAAGEQLPLPQRPVSLRPHPHPRRVAPEARPSEAAATDVLVLTPAMSLPTDIGVKYPVDVPAAVDPEAIPRARAAGGMR